MKINIGTEIDLTELLQSRLLIQANSGGGKSVLARNIIEQAYNHVPFIVLDFEGEYYSLKEKLTDLLIIGGQHADVAINLKSAVALPKEIIANQLNVVIDLSDLQNNERLLYSKHFLDAMMNLGREYWTSYFVFVEEAHKLCGEQDKQVSAGAVKDLMSRGRKRGYCGVLITQRISKLHKDAAAECNNKFIGRTFLDVDLKRAGAELGLSGSADINVIRNLKPGQFYAFGTAIVPHHVHTVKIKEPLTKIPKAGVNINLKPRAPTEKIKALLATLNNLTAEPAKKEMATTQSNTGQGKTYYHKEDLQKQKQLEEKISVQQKLLHDQEKTHQKIVDYCMQSVTKAFNLLEGVLREIKEFKEKKEQSIENTLPVAATIVKSKIDTVLTSTHPNNTNLGKCPYAILSFLASFPERSFSKAQIGIATEYSPNSGGFNNALSELNGMSLIIKDGAKIKASSNAAQFLGEDFEPKQYSIHTYKDKLGKCEREIYEVLLKHPKEAFTKQNLAECTPSRYSYNSGGFNNALSTLNTLELTKKQNGLIYLNPELLEI